MIKVNRELLIFNCELSVKVLFFNLFDCMYL